MCISISACQCLTSQFRLHVMQQEFKADLRICSNQAIRAKASILESATAAKHRRERRDPHVSPSSPISNDWLRIRERGAVKSTEPLLLRDNPSGKTITEDDHLQAG